MRGDFRIGPWLVQPQLNTIAREARTARVEPKAMQVLVYLAQNPDEVVSKERLIRAVWADTFVTDDVLTRCISELRKVFDDNAKDPHVIETIPRGGYRLLVPAEAAEAESEQARAHSRPWPAIAGLLAGFLGLALLLFALNVGGVRGRLSHPAQFAAVRSIAVLPLENLSHDPEQDYFSDGMTEELTTDLAKISALRVTSRTSAVHYKGSSKTLPQIARDLGVDAVVIGGVLRSGNRVRISVQLVDAAADRNLWAQSYEDDLHDVLSLQGQVANAIAEQVRVQLTPQERDRLASPRPISPEAYEAYLQGEYFWNQLTEEGIKKSIKYYEKAIRLAPDYAPAYASLAFSYNLLASSEFEPPGENYAKAKQFALQALEKDRNLSEAHAALGFALCYSDWNWPAAEAEFHRAIELNPRGGTAHHVYGVYLGAMGRSEEAIAEMKKDLEVDPLSVLTHLNFGWLYWTSGQMDRSLEQYQKILEIAPDSPDAHEGLGMVYAREKQYEEAIAELKKAAALSRNNAVLEASLGYGYAISGNKQSANEVLNDLKRRSKQQYVPAYLVATVYAGLGDKDSIFRWLEQAVTERDDLLVGLKEDPVFAPYRSDPRFTDLLRRIGFPQ